MSPSHSSPASGLALAVVGSVLFSAKAIVVKLSYRHGVDPATLIALRMLASVPFFLVAYWWTARHARPLTAHEHGQLVVIGLLGYYAASMLDFMGLQYISAGLERLILYLNPTLVLLLSALFLRRAIGRPEWTALALCYGGIALVVLHDVRLEGAAVPLGAALVFASAVCYALYLIVAGQLVQRIGAIRLTSYAMCVSTIAVLLQFALLHPPARLLQPAPVLWLSLVNGLLCTVLPVFATMLAVERIGAGRTAIAAMAGPVSTIVLAWVFLGEAVTRWQLAGTALILSGVFVLSRGGRAAPTPPSETAS